VKLPKKRAKNVSGTTKTKVQMKRNRNQKCHKIATNETRKIRFSTIAKQKAMPLQNKQSLNFNAL